MNNTYAMRDAKLKNMLNPNLALLPDEEDCGSLPSGGENEIDELCAMRDAQLKNMLNPDSDALDFRRSLAMPPDDENNARDPLIDNDNKMKKEVGPRLNNDIFINNTVNNEKKLTKFDEEELRRLLGHDSESEHECEEIKPEVKIEVNKPVRKTHSAAKTAAILRKLIELMELIDN